MVKNSNRGDTLVEVLSALAVVLILAVSVFSVHVYYTRINSRVSQHLYCESIMQDIKAYYDKYGLNVYIDSDNKLSYVKTDDNSLCNDRLAFAEYYFKNEDNLNLYHYNQSYNNFYAYFNSDYKPQEDEGKYIVYFWVDDEKLYINMNETEDDYTIIDTICFGESEKDNQCVDAYNSIASLLDDYYSRLDLEKFNLYLNNHTNDLNMYLYLNNNYEVIEKGDKDNISNSLYQVRCEYVDDCFIAHFYYRNSNYFNSDANAENFIYKYEKEYDLYNLLYNYTADKYYSYDLNESSDTDTTLYYHLKYTAKDEVNNISASYSISHDDDILYSITDKTDSIEKHYDSTGTLTNDTNFTYKIIYKYDDDKGFTITFYKDNDLYASYTYKNFKNLKQNDGFQYFKSINYGTKIESMVYKYAREYDIYNLLYNYDGTEKQYYTYNLSLVSTSTDSSIYYSLTNEDDTYYLYHNDELLYSLKDKETIEKHYDLSGQLTDDEYAYKIIYKYDNGLVIEIYDEDELYISYKYTDFNNLKSAIDFQYDLYLQENDLFNNEGTLYLNDKYGSVNDDTYIYELNYKLYNDQFYCVIKDKNNNQLEYLGNRDHDLRKKQIANKITDDFLNRSISDFDKWIVDYLKNTTCTHDIDNNEYIFYCGNNLKFINNDKNAYKITIKYAKQKSANNQYCLSVKVEYINEINKIKEDFNKVFNVKLDTLNTEFDASKISEYNTKLEEMFNATLKDFFGDDNKYGTTTNDDHYYYYNDEMALYSNDTTNHYVLRLALDGDGNTCKKYISKVTDIHPYSKETLIDYYENRSADKTSVKSNTYELRTDYTYSLIEDTSIYSYDGSYIYAKDLYNKYCYELDISDNTVTLSIYSYTSTGNDSFRYEFIDNKDQTYAMLNIYKENSTNVFASFKLNKTKNETDEENQT